MPFTLSHPAAALPFWPLVRRNYLPLCALAIGQMSPDFEYLWRLRTEWHWSHTPLGVFYFCLPVGLLATILWVRFVRAPTRALFAMRSDPIDTSPQWWLGATVAIVIGAFTHIWWDGLTHGTGWSDRLIPGLRHLVTIRGVTMPAYDVLQNISTVIGGLIVFAWLVREIRSGEPRALLAPWRIAVVTGIALVVSGFSVWNALRAGATFYRWPMQLRLAQASVGGLLGLGIGLMAYAALSRLFVPKEA